MGLGLNNNYESKPMCQPPLMRKINSWSSIWLVRSYLTFLIWMGHLSYSFKKKVFVGLNLTVSCYWQKFPPWAKVPPYKITKIFMQITMEMTFSHSRSGEQDTTLAKLQGRNWDVIIAPLPSFLQHMFYTYCKIQLNTLCADSLASTKFHTFQSCKWIS